MFSIESPYRGDSNENTQYTVYNINTKNHSKLSQVCSYEIFSKGLKNEFETAVVNESSVFEPLKFYCIWVRQQCLPVDIAVNLFISLMMKNFI